MTVIAWDGKMLAADRRMAIGNMVTTTRKIARIRGHLVGCAGASDFCQQFMEWFQDGAVKANWPEDQRKAADFASAMVITPDGRIHFYNRTPAPSEILDDFFAIGCGRDFALAAMYLGQSAVDAVGVACRFDSGCGNGVDVLGLLPADEDGALP